MERRGGLSRGEIRERRGDRGGGEGKQRMRIEEEMREGKRR